MLLEVVEVDEQAVELLLGNTAAKILDTEFELYVARVFVWQVCTFFSAHAFFTAFFFLL
jgi:hypothetical protein